LLGRKCTDDRRTDVQFEHIYSPRAVHTPVRSVETEVKNKIR